MVIFLAVKLKSHGLFSCHKLTTKTEKFSRHQLKTLSMQEGFGFFSPSAFVGHNITPLLTSLFCQRLPVSLGRHTTQLAYEEAAAFHSRHS